MSTHLSLLYHLRKRRKNNLCCLQSGLNVICAHSLWFGKVKPVMVLHYDYNSVEKCQLSYRRESIRAPH